MPSEKNTLVVNPGSASRKYAFFVDGIQKANFLFEFIDGKVAGRFNYLGVSQEIVCQDDLEGAASVLMPTLIDNGLIKSPDDIMAVGIRLVAPSAHFLKDELVTDEIIAELEKIELVAPLHIKTVLSEIRQIRKYMPNIPIVAVSDSAFHASKPTWTCHYGIDTELSDRLGIKRYGYHGISVRSIVKRMQGADILRAKTIICHLGSGSSVTAVNNGESYDNTMGYSPLEGLMMATRSGNIDISAAIAIKKELHFSDDELEHYLNEKCGLLGLSGSSNDIRKLVEYEEKGDERASLALELFVYRLQQAIGQMAASMGGVDCLVFTATVGERSYIIRERVIARLGFLGFKINKDVNSQTYEPTSQVNIGDKSSRPIYVISTDEAAEIAGRAGQFIDHISNY